MSERNTISFKDKVVIVVGAGPGLGTTLAGRFAEAGASVAAVARLEASLYGAIEATGRGKNPAIAISADITDIDDARSMATTVLDTYGRVDTVVNLAFGIAPRRNLVDMDDADLETWRGVVETGGFGTLLACRFLVPSMIEQGHGSVVNVISMSSRMAFAGRSEYAAGKAQSHKIAQSLADEVGPSGIRVNCVAPGHIWSDRLEQFYRQLADEQDRTYTAVLDEHLAQMVLRRIVTNDEVANAVLFLASDMASGITGAVLDVNAGQLFSPQLALVSSTEDLPWVHWNRQPESSPAQRKESAWGSPER